MDLINSLLHKFFFRSSILFFTQKCVTHIKYNNLYISRQNIQYEDEKKLLRKSREKKIENESFFFVCVNDEDTQLVSVLQYSEYLLDDDDS